MTHKYHWIRKILISAFLISSCANLAYSAPIISGIAASNTSVGQYNKFELTFNVSTAATNLYWPYDTTPNTGVPARVGVSVDGLFSNDNWQTTIVQPGFYYQDYSTSGGARTISNGRNWLYPNGNPAWKIRFAPNTIGNWKYRIRITDVSGTTTSPEGSFTCVASNNHGFVRISPNDSRYFELSDGTYVPMIGLSYDAANSIDAETKFAQLSAMGVNLIRSWWQSSNPNLALFGAGGQGGDLNWNNINYSNEYVRPGHLISSKLDKNGGPNALYTTVPIKPSTRYRYSAWIKTVNITGSGAYGVYLEPFYPGGKSEMLQGTNDWKQIYIDFTTNSDQYEITWLSVKMDNVTGGAAYISDLSLKEDKGGGIYGQELLMRADLQAHTSFPQPTAWTIDQLLDIAAKNGIYIRACIEEKSDSFYSRIQSDGSWGSPSDDNVYANTTHASRTYQSYYWRYLAARYGYSTALHSVEYVNEGDPFNGNHYDATIALADFFKANDPNQHLASTSNWHSFPPSLWRNSKIGTADLHMYMGWNVASGGHRVFPGWDGTWSAPGTDTLGTGLSIDNSIAHTGMASLKYTVPAASGTPRSPTQGNAQFQVGAVPGHQIRVSAWVKAQNNAQYSEPYSWQSQGFFLYYSTSGGDYAGEAGDFLVPWGTYDWQRVTKTFTVPSNVGILGVVPRFRSVNSSSPGYIWIDDVVVEDLTSGIVMNYNGGFEYQDSESYDVAAGHCAYSRLTRSFGTDKPIIRGETGFCHPQRYTSDYKGFRFTGEDQQLLDDNDGIFWKKWVWANADPGGLYEVYWWPHVPMAKNYAYGKAFQNFMADVPLSNGHYVDIAADVSDPRIRVIGQKDLTNNMAHLWIDNIKHTWKNVVDGVNIPSLTGTITISGFKDGQYKLDWWDTINGALKQSQTVTCSNGKISIPVQNLQSDTACKIYSLTAPSTPANITVRVLTNPSSAGVGETVTVTVQFTNTGETSASNVVVTADVPPETTYLAGSAEATGGTYNSGTNKVSWNIGTLAANATGTKTFQVKIK